MSKHSHEGSDNHHDHHGHSHGEVTYNKSFLIAIIANSVFVVLQIVYAYIANSTSLLADAFHNLGDVLGLILAWIAIGLMSLKPTKKATYGLKKTSILAALVNGGLLIFTCGIIATEAVYKLMSPTEIQAVSVMIVAGIGIIVNGTTALLFLRGSDDLNIRGAYLHLFYDALVSVGVVFSAALLYWTGWLWIDPVVGILIALVILKGTWSLFADSFRLIIDGVPRAISWAAVSEFLISWPGVQSIHDLHIWAMSTKENALSVHLYMPNDFLSDESRAEMVEQLRKQFGIQHVTIQTEKTEKDCNDACHSPMSWI
ncbi:cation diffusion facilitator family transporter [Legionella bononiensis]|uniref:Cation transporter n=1 Tax=Legionella bononiensis TaxID=2793102 RepID=A0ABS1WA02_9GAMM|nr:cation diffusion facilitator family transporter [Legionella bononiensis]MBL7480637.1 cation transporter [Legionella bononiensis]MBL7526164.1 cation transporter [Legionella bononiensis]MBL7563341.1 cation transporter [Legionella bononiensis]